ERIATHPLASLTQLRRAARQLRVAGEAEKAARADRRILELDPGDHPRRRLAGRLDGQGDLPLFDRFRVEAAPLIAAFEPGPREAAAPSTLLLDQMLVQIHPDGSWVSQVHTLRR